MERPPVATRFLARSKLLPVFRIERRQRRMLPVLRGQRRLGRALQPVRPDGKEFLRRSCERRPPPRAHPLDVFRRERKHGRARLSRYRRFLLLAERARPPAAKLWLAHAIATPGLRARAH